MVLIELRSLHEVIIVYKAIQPNFLLHVTVSPSIETAESSLLGTIALVPSKHLNVRQWQVLAVSH